MDREFLRLETWWRTFNRRSTSFGLIGCMFVLVSSCSRGGTEEVVTYSQFQGNVDLDGRPLSTARLYVSLEGTILVDLDHSLRFDTYHWHVDDGNGNRTRLMEEGNTLTEKEAHDPRRIKLAKNPPKYNPGIPAVAKFSLVLFFLIDACEHIFTAVF